MKSAMKWGLAVAALGAVSLAAGGASAASGDEPDDDEKQPDDDTSTKGETGFNEVGVRHGIRFEGCRHFELVDADAVEAWAINNAWKFRQWAFRLDEVRANPEPALVDFMKVLFPECSWPPPPTATFGPERLGWADAMEQATVAAQTIDLAPTTEADAPGQAASLLTMVLSQAFRGPFPSGEVYP